MVPPEDDSVGEAVDICMQASILKGNNPLLADKCFEIEMLRAAIGGGVMALIRPEFAVEEAVVTLVC